MNIARHDLIMLFIFAFPMLMVGVGVWWRKRRMKRSAEFGEVLRRRTE